MKNVARGKLEIVPIEKVTPNDWNPNSMDEKMQAREAKSIDMFGIVRSILVREHRGKYEIIDGYHRWLELKKRGTETAPVRNLGKVSRDEAMAMSIALNGIHGEPDFFKLSDLFARITSYNPEQMAELLPHTPDEIRAMIDAVEYDWGEYDFTDEDEDTEYATIICRIPADDLGPIKTTIDQLCQKYGISHDKPAVRLGLLLSLALRGFKKSTK